jgi:hypothetical protein
MLAVTAALMDSTRFPNLQLVTLVGFSAGAQFVNRFAVFANATRTIPGAARDARAAPHLRFVASDASSYLYVGPQRPAAGCTPLRDTGPGWQCPQFPPYPDPNASCPTFNMWKYGLEGLAGYDSLFLKALSPAAVAAAVAALPSVDLRFLLGVQDVCNCNTVGYTVPPSCIVRDPTGAPYLCPPDATGGPGCCDRYVPVVSLCSWVLQQ